MKLIYNEGIIEIADDNLFVTIESGGSIGEIANNGRNRIFGGYVFLSKEEAKAKTKKCSKLFGGGYYDYHYQTKTLAWARANCEKFSEKDLTFQM